MPDHRTRGQKRAKRAPRKQARRGRDSQGAKDARAAFFEQAATHTPYLGVETGEGRYVVSTRSVKLGKHLFCKQGRPEFGVLRRAMAVIDALVGADATQGQLFVDVGANMGTSTISALLSHGFDSAICIEPEEENHRLLRASLALNDLEHVRTIRAAASDRLGQAKLVVVGGPPGKTWLLLDDAMLRDIEERRAAKPTESPYEMFVSEVELVTLDHLVKDGIIDAERAGMLWIDVEGHEGHVLGGAETLTERGVPTVFEFDPAILELRGDRQAIHRIAESRYTHFVDLRRQDERRPRYQLRPVSDLAELASRFLDSSTSASYTDVLMLKLEPDQARAGDDLPELMARRGAPSSSRGFQSARAANPETGDTDQE